MASCGGAHCPKLDGLSPGTKTAPCRDLERRMPNWLEELLEQDLRRARRGSITTGVLELARGYSGSTSSSLLSPSNTEEATSATDSRRGSGGEGG
jgi:hypothetical protein